MRVSTPFSTSDIAGALHLHDVGHDQDWPLYSARSPSWKLFAWPSRQAQLLFDLTTDAGETLNLVGKRPDLFAGLGLLLRRHLERTADRRLPADEVELSPDAERALRALGYLD